MMQNIFYIILGWLLGLLSPIIFDKYQSQKRREAIKHSIVTEIEDLRFRLALFSHNINAHLGTINRKLLESISPIICAHLGSFQEQEVKTALEGLMGKTDAELAVIYPPRSPYNIGLRMCMIHIPFTENNVSSLHHFSIDFQKLVFSIISQLNILNDNIAQANDDFDKTFESNMERENVVIIRGNILKAYKRLDDKAQYLIKIITDLLVATS